MLDDNLDAGSQDGLHNGSRDGSQSGLKDGLRDGLQGLDDRPEAKLKAAPEAGLRANLRIAPEAAPRADSRTGFGGSYAGGVSDAGRGGDAGSLSDARGEGAIAPPPRPMVFELRPLSTGEILDRTFALYRGRFWVYVGLSALCSGVSTLGSIGRLLYFGSLNQVTGIGAKGAQGVVLSVSVSILLGILTFVAYSVTQAATTSAVASVYLGHETSIERALRAVRGQWFRYVTISFWQIGAAAWLPILLLAPAVTLLILRRGNAGWIALAGFLFLLGFASFAYAVIAYIRNSLAIPAAVMEGLKVRAAMRRSKDLVAGRKGRVFLLLLLLYVLSVVATGVELPFAILIQGAHATHRVLNEVLLLVTAFLANSLIIPVGAISFCLFYIDERVRREGFDVEALMDPTLGGVLGQAVSTDSFSGTEMV